jgi:transcriptional regulator with XRE-family HTH domain
MTLRTARQSADLTIRELADLAKVDHTTVFRLEESPTRYLRAQYHTVVNLARVLGCNPLDLFPVLPVLAPASETRARRR